MRKILLILFFCIGAMLSLSSCGGNGPNVNKHRKLYEKYFEKHLKDPQSFIVYKEDYIIDGYSIKWTLDYGAKNSFGGMKREVVEFTTIKETIFINNYFYKLKDLE